MIWLAILIFMFAAVPATMIVIGEWGYKER
jgi:hypothetical protein